MKNLASSTKSTPETDATLSCESKKIDYWTWYYGTDNAIRRWDEAHGIRLVRSETTGCPTFVADRDVLFADTPNVSTYPSYFETRTLDKFVVGLYSFGANRDKAQAAFDVVKKYVENYAMIVAQYSGGGLYFYSKERGTGKTFLSTILGNELSLRGRRVRWYGMTNLLQEIKAGYDRDSSTSSSEIINLCRNAEVLILDDIGVEKQSAWVNETMYTILDYRMTQCKPTIFTSNHRPHELSYDERIIDRITRMTELVELPEESIRKKLNAKNQLGAFLSK
jgi:DNA replication protein DnaC